MRNMGYSKRQYVMTIPYGNEDNYSFKPDEEIEMKHIVNKDRIERDLTELINNDIIHNVSEIPFPYKLILSNFYRRDR